MLTPACSPLRRTYYAPLRKLPIFCGRANLRLQKLLWLLSRPRSERRKEMSERLEKLLARALKVDRWLECEGQPDATLYGRVWYARLYGGPVEKRYGPPTCGDCGTPISIDPVARGQTLNECLDNLDAILTEIEQTEANL
jgi:hypothetical protein